MSAPSQAHEQRRRQLDDLAFLAGYPIALELGDDVVPDVARSDSRGRRFVGDAKATEAPGCTETFRRLSRYARRLAYLGCDRDVLVLAVPAQARVSAWGVVLERAAHGAGLRPSAYFSSELDADTALVHVVVSGAARPDYVLLDEGPGGP